MSETPRPLPQSKKRPLGLRGASKRDIFPRFAAARPPEHLPSAVSYRYGEPPIFDQGDEEDCEANVVARALAWFWHKRSSVKAWTDFSRAAIYSQGKYYYEGADFSQPGMLPASGFQYVQDRGPVLESAFPSTDANVQRTTPLDPSLCLPQYKISGFKEVEPDPFSMKQAMHEAGPLAVAVDWSDSFYNPEADGTLPAPSFSDGGHFLWFDEYADAEDAFGFANSWGDAWGLGGYAYYPYAYVEATVLNVYAVSIH